MDARCSGNPQGRPVGVGARNAFTTDFLRDLQDVWRECGKDTMLHTAKISRTRSSLRVLDYCRKTFSSASSNNSLAG